MNAREHRSEQQIPTFRRLTPTLVAAAAAAAYLIVGPTGADLPAQLYRTRLFGVEGFGLWSNWWYGGHYLPSYSVLFPLLAWLATPQVVAGLAGVITATAFAALAFGAFGEEAWVGAVWLGLATVVEPLSGRLTFALGLCGAALATLALARRRNVPATALAFLTALTSPVAALFAALAGASVLCAGLAGPRSRHRLMLSGRGQPDRDYGSKAAGAAVLLAALIPVAALAIAFPQGGSQPFALGTLWPILAVAASLLVVLPRDALTLRIATVLYAAGCFAAYAIPTPVGANAARLGELTAGPLAALLLYRRGQRSRLALLALAALPLAYLQVHDVITDVQHASHSPSDTVAYYRPLIRFLEARPGAKHHTFRVEVPFTQGHWEASRLALRFPLARGWERQLDIAEDSLFYEGRLTASSYARWLHRMAVRYVALADAPLDYSSRAEGALIAAGLPYLQLLRRLSHWRIYRVRGATPIATGAAALTALGAQSTTLRFSRPGSAYVRIRYSPYWQLQGLRGCVAADGAFIRVRAEAAGTARLTMAFAPSRIGARSPRCS